ncbi:D-alanyl-D-alanine carboxypeptidase [Neorhizobium lilium]|uniref:D-alanyl-D-alanine carboxypeptidase n=1 Tax=Neorhizobium lilium TaxID=2503024 RepID=A0A3S3RD75_9HYPH|nr:D-alanyl-D-alanine carboxypeptidase family protein [Neorhizobium lilium]RWX74424.1 D-alanyl-D-alanine carboxypeptidase [Neorhizobium lilium]
MLISRLRPVFAQRLLSAVAAASLFLSAQAAAANPQIIVDVKTGRVIAHRDAFVKWYGASLTKLMTAYVAFDALKSGRIKLDSIVTMSKKATDQPPSKMGFTPGTTMTLDTALKMMLVKSANDMAYAVGEAVGGSMDHFVEMMNAEAIKLGMNSTNYINPNGLPGKGQYTTARDLAVLTLRLKRDFPEYQTYFALEGIDTGKRQYHNYNTLIGRFDGADGMKTGFICASGFNQIGSATRAGRTVIAVVLGSDSLAGRADDTANLLQQGLSASATEGVPLVSLPAYGDTTNVNDVSADICNPKAAKVRSETRDDAGRTVQHSPYIHEMDHPPQYSIAMPLTGGEPPPPPPKPPKKTVDKKSTDKKAVDKKPAASPAAEKKSQTAADVPLPNARPNL